MTYRPITDLWLLTRTKLKGGKKWYGAYPGGFPERARSLLGVTIHQPVLHVCGGMARHYPYPNGFGANEPAPLEFWHRGMPSDGKLTAASCIFAEAAKHGWRGDQMKTNGAAT